MPCGFVLGKGVCMGAVQKKDYKTENRHGEMIRKYIALWKNA